MDRIEIETITEAMATKQTWIRKELQDLLEVWAKLTTEKISEFQYLRLADVDEDEEYDGKTIYIERGYLDLYYNPSRDKYGEHEKAYDLTDMNSKLIRKVCKNIPEKLTAYFKGIQDEIDAYSTAGKEIRDIINRLR